MQQTNTKQILFIVIICLCKISITLYLLFNCSLLLSRCVLINGKRALLATSPPTVLAADACLLGGRFSLLVKAFSFLMAFWLEVPARGTPNPTLVLGLTPTDIPYLAGCL